MAKSLFENIGTGIFKPIGDLVGGAVTALQPGRSMQLGQKYQSQQLRDQQLRMQILNGAQIAMSQAQTPEEKDKIINFLKKANFSDEMIEAAKVRPKEKDKFGTYPGYWQQLPEEKWPEAAEKLAFGGRKGTKPDPLATYKRWQESLMYESDPEAEAALEAIRPNLLQQVTKTYGAPPKRGAFGGLSPTAQPSLPPITARPGQPVSYDIETQQPSLQMAEQGPPVPYQAPQLAEPERPEELPKGAKWIPTMKGWEVIENGVRVMYYPE